MDDTRLTDDSAESRYPSIAVDSSNNPHIAWYDERDGNKEIYYTKGSAPAAQAECLGTCYEGTICEDVIIAEMNCSECLAVAGRSWENYEFDSPCNPGYMVPRLCYDYCLECCDGTDSDGVTDWHNDPECACCLDETEDLDEGCPAPCVPELATFTLVGGGD